MESESTAAPVSPTHPTTSAAPASEEPKTSSPTMSGALLQGGEAQSSDAAATDAKGKWTLFESRTASID